MPAYYHIVDLNLVGKTENFVPYLYDKTIGWTVDKDNILMDRVMGYDGESIGSSSMLFSVEEITEKQAEDFINSL